MTDHQHEVDYFSQLCGLQNGAMLDLQSTKMSQECTQVAKGPILQQWLEKWLGANLTHTKVAGKTPVWLSDSTDSLNGSLWMRNSSEHMNTLGLSHNEGDVCWQIFV